jgi:hypothetical protein
MSDEIFYVYPQNGRDKYGNPSFDKGKKIAAKFLVVNGKLVVDSNPGGSQQAHIYSGLNADGSINESTIFSNPHNYLIVPANYDPAEAVNFAARINKSMTVANALGEPTVGEAAGLAAMANAFWPGHEQDLQRGERWGVPPHEVSPAFTDAASWNLGYITQMTMLPNETAVMGGGALNILEYFWEEYKRHHGKGSVSTHHLFPLGMSETDHKAFLAGVESAKETQKTKVSDPGTKPQQKADNLEGQTYLEKLRYYKAQALAEAAQKPESFHQILMKALRVQRSYAPIRKRQSGQAKPEKPADAAPWPVAELANTPHRRLMNFLQQNPHPAATLMASIARSAAASPGLALAGFVRNMAGDTSAAPSIPPAVFYEYAKNNPWLRTASNSPAASLAKAALRPALPSIAPRRSAPSGYARQRGGAPAEFELATMPNGPAMLPTGGFAPGAQSGAPAVDASLASTAITQRQVKSALRDYFNAQARLPPSGATGFDPRLTPAWAGQKFVL